MKAMRMIALAMALGVAVTPVVAGSSDDVSMVAANVPVSGVLEMYGVICGKKVVLSEEVRALKYYVTFRIQKVSKGEALRLIEAALLKQAGIELVHGSDGTVAARPASTRK